MLVTVQSYITLATDQLASKEDNVGSQAYTFF